MWNNVINATHLRKASVSAGGKFFLAAIVHQTTDDQYYFLTNNGPGPGGAVNGVWCRTGQVRVYGPWDSIDAARFELNKKVTAKQNEGYEGAVVVVNALDPRAITALADKRRASGQVAPATPVSAPPGPSQDSVTSWGLLSEAFSPDLAGRILAHRQKLAADIKDLSTQLANKQAEDELLANRLSACQ